MNIFASLDQLWLIRNLIEIEEKKKIIVVSPCDLWERESKSKNILAKKKVAADDIWNQEKKYPT